MSNIEVQTSDGSGVTRALIDDGKILQIRVPIQYKHRQGRRQILVRRPQSPENATLTRSSENIQLVLAIAHAHRWLELIDSGELPSISVLAKRLNLDISYVNRMIRFALLAPDIIEEILNGEEPNGMSIRNLYKKLPDIWSEQREYFGIFSCSLGEN